jgi:hypothetical protein
MFDVIWVGWLEHGSLLASSVTLGKSLPSLGLGLDVL